MASRYDVLGSAIPVTIGRVPGEINMLLLSAHPFVFAKSPHPRTRKDTTCERVLFGDTGHNSRTSVRVFASRLSRTRPTEFACLTQGHKQRSHAARMFSDAAPPRGKSHAGRKKQ